MDLSLEEIVALIYLIIRRRRNRRRNRRWWVRPMLQKRKEQGAYQNLCAEMRLSDRESFFNFYRMTPDLFDKLLTFVGPVIQKEWTIREPISAAERLSLTIRYLASGDSMKSMSYLYRVSASSVSKIIYETSEALWTQLSPIVIPDLAEVNWNDKAKEFERLWNFPLCCGAIDGKHIILQAPSNTGSLYYNYKGFFSIILLAICDANYIFTCVDIGAMGRQSDGGVFQASNMGVALENETFGLPVPTTLPHDDAIQLPYVIVGDEAFPLKSNLMRPYPGKHLNNKKIIFNYRLSRARRTIENSFGIMAARWRILRKAIISSLDTSNAITKAVVVLHNFLQTSDVAKLPTARMYCPPKFADYEDENGIVQSGNWRRDTVPLPSIRQQGSNRYGYTVANIREEFANYFVSEIGSVPWQWNHLPRIQN